MTTFDKEEKKVVETIIDRHGITPVLDMVSEVCYGKGEHLATNWQALDEAYAWEKLAEKLGNWWSEVLPANYYLEDDGTDKDSLEALTDRKGIVFLLEMFSEICREKANTSNAGESKEWKKMAERISKMRIPNACKFD